MGLESANYLFLPDGSIEGLDAILASLGAIRHSNFPGSDYPRWILRAEDFWLDLLLGDLGPGGSAAVSIRIALCNPLFAVTKLRELLTSLMASMPGRLFDKQTRRSHRNVSDETWKEIETALMAKRSSFQENFGPFEAAISGEDVFSSLPSRG